MRPISRADVFELAGRLALSSHHPVAAAVAQAADARSPLVGAVEEAGQGVRAVIDGVEIRLGRPSFCGAERWSPSRQPRSRSLRRGFQQGDEKFILSVRQGLRPDAQAVIAALKARDIGIEILSGDREPAVIAAAQALGIAEWRAGVTPADKIARIEELKRRGEGA